MMRRNLMLSVSYIQRELFFIGDKLRFCLYEKWINLHFPVFTLSLLAEIQLKTIDSSLLKKVDIEVVALFSNLQVSVLSSANKVNLKRLEQLGKSLMKIRKSSGPRREPCGTSQSTERTYYFLFVRYDLNQSKARARTPYTLILCNRILWSTQSKPLEKSKNIEITEWSLSRLSYMYGKVLIIASDVDVFSLNPNCDGLNSSKWSR